MSHPSYLALDPGDVSGWATFNELGVMLEMGQVPEKDWVKFLTENISNNPDLKHVICENYVLFQHKALAQTNAQGRKLKTSKKVGQVEMTCDLVSVPLTLQEASKYRIGAMWGGFEIPTNHDISHQYVAVAHGVFYLQQAGIRRPTLGAS